MLTRGLPLVFRFCILNYASYRFAGNLIDLWEVQNSAANLQVTPIGVNLCNRAGELQIVLLVYSVIDNSDDLSLLKFHKSLIYLCN